MLDRDEVASRIGERLPREWHRASIVPGLQHRILEVLRDPRHGELDEQIDVLGTLLRLGDRLDEEQWLDWAAYAFDPASRQPGAYASAGGSTP